MEGLGFLKCLKGNAKVKNAKKFIHLVDGEKAIFNADLRLDVVEVAK
jgi:hypothetical protein